MAGGTGAAVALVARLSLGAAFAVSAGAKLARPGAFTSGLAAFGVPAPKTVARVLPLIEGLLAAGLVALPGQAWPAFAAIGFLALLTGAVAANLVAGRHVPCPCFRPEGAGPISAATVFRNGVLLALGILATGPTEGAPPGPTAAAAVVAVVATVAALRRFG
jgi:hypothetical protein